ncbi:family 20 glycosylhydrolase [Arthrobacter terrae]|uniref:family 20 glycosylhydrolase n=1 Tax=Arthrobacter terrae TaxID=2935737 RepID=UPI0028B1EC5C|nr:family 20 glycosylhydrolase [Arthrobacter terrae]
MPAMRMLIPSVQSLSACGVSWAPTEGTKVVVDPVWAAELGSEATTLANELPSEGYMDTIPTTVLGGPVGENDIYLSIGVVSSSAKAEAYRMGVSDGLKILASDGAGAFYASRTLLQALKIHGKFTGTVLDWPAYKQRGVMLDIARKHYTSGWIERLICDMSYRKLNVLQLHLSDSQGFRVESRKHPEIVSKQHLSLDEVRKILKVAKRYHVEVIPDIDTPAHLDHILKTHPEWRLKLRNGGVLDSHMDYSIPAVRGFVKELVEEMADVFPGKYFHLGGDEFFPAPWQTGSADVVNADTAPHLVEYAASVAGRGATIFDGYKHYLNELIVLLKSRNKTAKVWNDDIYPEEGVLELDKSTEVEGWVRWNRSKPNAGVLADAGYPVVNANGDYLYFILTGEGVGAGLNKCPEGIYERWHPRRFMGVAGDGGNYDLPDEKPLLGAHLSIWADVPNALTQAQVASGFLPWQSSFAQQMWGSPMVVGSYREFTGIIAAIGTSPALVNAATNLREPAATVAS